MSLVLAGLDRAIVHGQGAIASEKGRANRACRLAVVVRHANAGCPIAERVGATLERIRQPLGLGHDRDNAIRDGRRQIRKRRPRHELPIAGNPARPDPSRFGAQATKPVGIDSIGGSCAAGTLPSAASAATPWAGLSAPAEWRPPPPAGWPPAPCPARPAGPRRRARPLDHRQVVQLRQVGDRHLAGGVQGSRRPPRPSATWVWNRANDRPAPCPPRPAAPRHRPRPFATSARNRAGCRRAPCRPRPAAPRRRAGSSARRAAPRRRYRARSPRARWSAPRRSPRRPWPSSPWRSSR